MTAAVPNGDPFLPASIRKLLLLGAIALLGPLSVDLRATAAALHLTLRAGKRYYPRWVNPGWRTLF